jgi:hypothetical protein
MNTPVQDNILQNNEPSITHSQGDVPPEFDIRDLQQPPVAYQKSRRAEPGPAPMNLQFWAGAVLMILIATLTTSLVTNTGRATWFVGVMALMIYTIFAMTLYLLPPQSQ